MKNDNYLRRFDAGVTSFDVLDIDPANDQATIVGDLCDVGTLTPGSLDCAVVTQTLMFVPDPSAAVENLLGALSDGGVLLLTCTVIGRVDPDIAHLDRWRMTPVGLGHLIENAASEVGCGVEVQVRGLGNLVTALAYLHGLAGEELRERELVEDDPHFPILAAARVLRCPKPG